MSLQFFFLFGNIDRHNNPVGNEGIKATNLDLYELKEFKSTVAFCFFNLFQTQSSRAKGTH